MGHMEKEKPSISLIASLVASAAIIVVCIIFLAVYH